LETLIVILAVLQIILGSTGCRDLTKMPCPILLVFLYLGWFIAIK
jgi:hypothetical protein